VQGYRIDAAVLKRTSTDLTGRWRSLVGREVGYFRPTEQNGQATTEHRDIEADFLRSPEVRSRRAREDGYVQPMTQLKEDAAGQVILEHHDVLFAWQGDTLGLPALADGDPKTGEPPLGATLRPNPADDLAIDVVVDLPADPARYPPPLRAGRSYVFGARAVLTNGCGLDLPDAERRYAAERLWLGAGGDTAYLYQRHEAVRAPDVLLAWDDEELVESAAMPYGESLEDLVVHRVGDQTRRFVTPPSVPFHLSEQHGAFDALNTVDTPPGSLANTRVMAMLNPFTGEFPVARRGGWGFPTLPKPRCPDGRPGELYDLGKIATGSEDDERSRGAVLVLDDRCCPPARPRYADPLARILRARLVDGEDASGFESSGDGVPFWRDDDASNAPSAAEPVYLELVGRTAAALKGKRGRVKPGGVAQVYAEPSRRPVVLRKLQVELAPGETAQLELWAETDADRMRREHAVPDGALRRVAAAGKGRLIGPSALALADADPDAALACVQRQGPVAIYQHQHRLNVAHTVPRPLEAPRFDDVDKPDAFRPGKTIAGPTLHAVTLTVQPSSRDSTAPGPEKETWPSYVARQDPEKLYAWPSEAGGSTTFFVGEALTDRLTTGKLRCEASWVEHSPERYVQADDGSWRYQPMTNNARLFTLEAEPVRRRLFGQPVSFLKDDAHAYPETARPSPPPYRELSFSFANGKARRLDVSLVANSRWTGHYPGLSDAQLDLPSAPTPFKSEVWTTCTFRPPPPEVERVLPIFRWKKAVKSARRVVFTRETGLRIYLKRNWFASGEGEMLGVILPILGGRPLFQEPVCQLDGIGRFDQFVSRCGADPIHHSGASDGLLRAEDFIPKDPKDARRPSFGPATFPLRLADPGAPGAPPEEPAELPVTILGYHPMAPQAGDEGHYCDLHIDPKGVYFPFVQLGLTRLQVHAVKDLELSHPIAEFAQLPPRREVEVEFDGPKKFVVRVRGVGFNDEKALAELRREVGDALFLPRGPTPLLNITVLQAINADEVTHHRPEHIRWKPVLRSGELLQKRQQAPQVLKGAAVEWSVPMELPSRRGDPVRRYAVLVEEVETMAARDQAAPVERGPFLSRIIDLGPWVHPNDDDTW